MYFYTAALSSLVFLMRINFENTFHSSLEDKAGTAYQPRYYKSNTMNFQAYYYEPFTQKIFAVLY